VPERRGGATPSYERDGKLHTDSTTPPVGHPSAGGEYSDIPGFCMAAPLSRVAELDYVLTPGRYVGLADEEDDFDFAERFGALKLEFEGQLKEEVALNTAILENLKKVKVNG